MSITIFKTNKFVFYVDDKIRNSVNKTTIINKYSIPIEDRRSKITFIDKKISKKSSSKSISKGSRTSISKSTPKSSHEVVTEKIKTQRVSSNKTKKDSKKESHPELQQKIHFHDDDLSVKKPSLNKRNSNKIINNSQTSEQKVINTLIEYIPPKIEQTPGKLNQLKYGHASQYENVEDKWEPFICKVIKRLFSKKLGRYILHVDDGDGNVYKVHIASQLFELIKNNTINVGDWIKVNNYSATNMSNDKPRTVIFINIEKS